MKSERDRIYRKFHPEEFLREQVHEATSELENCTEAAFIKAVSLLDSSHTDMLKKATPRAEAIRTNIDAIKGLSPQIGLFQEVNLLLPSNLSETRQLPVRVLMLILVNFFTVVLQTQN